MRMRKKAPERAAHVLHTATLVCGRGSVTRCTVPRLADQVKLRRRGGVFRTGGRGVCALWFTMCMCIHMFMFMSYDMPLRVRPRRPA